VLAAIAMAGRKFKEILCESQCWLNFCCVFSSSLTLVCFREYPGVDLTVEYLTTCETQENISSARRLLVELALVRVTLLVSTINIVTPLCCSCRGTFAHKVSSSDVSCKFSVVVAHPQSSKQQRKSFDWSYRHSSRLNPLGYLPFFFS
jgi:hypothetical protein